MKAIPNVVFISLFSLISFLSLSQSNLSASLVAFTREGKPISLNDSIGKKYCVFFFKHPYCSQCLSELEDYFKNTDLGDLKVVFVLVEGQSLSKYQFQKYIKEFIPSITSVFFMNSPPEMLKKYSFKTNPHAIFIKGEDVFILDYSRIFNLRHDVGFTNEFLKIFTSYTNPDNIPFLNNPATN